MAAPSVNVDDAKGLAFACLPGCGFCCTATPLVQPSEAAPLGALVERADDGTLRIPISGPACSALQPDMRCGVYDARPAVCRLYPYAVHAGRRIQVTVTLACPGVVDRRAPHAHHAGALHPARDTEDMTQGAREAAGVALAQTGATALAAHAKETFAEFDRRMKEWGVGATPDRLRAGFLPHAARLAEPGALASLFAGVDAGDLVLEGNAARAVEALFAAEPSADPYDLLRQAAVDALDEPDVPLWVEPDLTWTTASMGDALALRRWKDGRWSSKAMDVDALPLDWTEDAQKLLATYLARLMHRDHTEGAAAWLVDASGYQATLAAAYARVLGEASLQVMLRAGMLAADEGRAEVDAALARRGVAAYETSYHSLPTLGAVL